MYTICQSYSLTLTDCCYCSNQSMSEQLLQISRPACFTPAASHWAEQCSRQAARCHHPVHPAALMGTVGCMGTALPTQAFPGGGWEGSRVGWWSSSVVLRWERWRRVLQMVALEMTTRGTCPDHRMLLVLCSGEIVGLVNPNDIHQGAGCGHAIAQMATSLFKSCSLGVTLTWNQFTLVLKNVFIAIEKKPRNICPPDQYHFL